MLLLSSFACTFTNGVPETAQPTDTIPPAQTSTPLPPAPVQPGAANPNEPVVITGDIPYTSPFFLNSAAEPFVMLEDEAGFVRRDREFVFELPGQSLGAVELDEQQKLTYTLALPAVPQGTLLDVDNNGKQDLGVQIFAVAYWSNTWGGPFLEVRDGTGWSNAYTSAITDPNRDNEIIGGTLIVWAPDAGQSFPTGFGTDKLLFTQDDPTAPIPAGYNLVDLNQEPFRVYKEPQPKITLEEGVVAVNDFSDQSYGDAFQSMFDKVSREYPFTSEKGVNWQALKDEFAPKAEQANNPNDFYRVLRDFSYQIPDGHVGISFNNEVFYSERGGGIGLVLEELSDGRVIAEHVLPDLPASQAGVLQGAEIISWNGQPIDAAISEVIPYFGPYSTAHTRRIQQTNFLTRFPPDTEVQFSYKNPGDTAAKEARLTAIAEYDSLFKFLYGADQDELALPVESYTLQESGLGYIQISTFSDDYHLMAQLWERTIQNLIDAETPGIIIDLRDNGGGSLGLALDFAGYFFDQEIDLYENLYYNELTGVFEPPDYPTRIKPGPLLYEGPIAVLVSPNCVSACEGFAYALSQQERAIIVGHYPSAGAFGEVGRGQYSLPEELSMQFPTGRPQSENGQVVIEGTGVIPSITVPVTEQSVIGEIDTVLQAAIEAVLEKIKS
jgi:C-terminal processing protease CtpA/Prc